MRGRGLLANLEASAGTAIGDEWVDSDADAVSRKSEGEPHGPPQ